MNSQTTCKPIKEAREKIHLHGSDKAIGIGPSKGAVGCSAFMHKASLVAAQTDPRQVTTWGQQCGQRVFRSLLKGLSKTFFSSVQT